MTESAPSIRTLLVDDEDAARQILREYLEPHRSVEVVGECRNGFEAIKAVAELEPDLLFLDVRMPKLDGFEVLELLGDEAPPAVIFVTAYDEYALKAFEVHALDYLLKPFSRQRLAEALGRVGARREEAPPPAGELARAAKPEPGYLERILVRQGSRVHVIAVDRLDYVEAQDDYVALVAAGEKRRKQQTLSRLAAGLDPRRFVHVHRSYVLNVDRLVRIELYAKDSRVAILRDGTRIPVSRAGYARLRKLL